MYSETDFLCDRTLYFLPERYLKDIFGEDCLADVMEIKSIGANFHLSLSLNIAWWGCRPATKFGCRSLLSISPSCALDHGSAECFCPGEIRRWDSLQNGKLKRLSPGWEEVSRWETWHPQAASKQRTSKPLPLRAVLATQNVELYLEITLKQGTFSQDCSKQSMLWLARSVPRSPCPCLLQLVLATASLTIWNTLVSFVALGVLSVWIKQLVCTNSALVNILLCYFPPYCLHISQASRLLWFELEMSPQALWLMCVNTWAPSWWHGLWACGISGT